MIRYEFSDVAVIRAKKTRQVAQVYGRTIADVVNRAGIGSGAYATLFDEAREPEHPMHGEFDWDMRVAARKWNLERARQLIKAIAIVDAAGAKQRAFISVTVERPDGGVDRFYAGRTRVLSTDTLRLSAQRSLVAATVGFLESWKSLLVQSDQGAALVASADAFLHHARQQLEPPPPETATPARKRKSAAGMARTGKARRGADGRGRHR